MQPTETPTQCWMLMKRNVFTANPTWTVAKAAETMRREGIGFLPIVDAQQRVVGVITDRDLAIRGFAGGLPPETPVEQIMTRELVTCRISDDVSVAEARMIQHRKWRILVVNDQCQLMGIITLVDLAHAAGPFKAGILLRHLVDRDYRVEAPRPTLPQATARGRSRGV